MSKFKYEKQFIFIERTADDAQRFLKDRGGINLAQVVDQKHNNCIHQCAFQGSLSLLQVYVNHQRGYYRKNPFLISESQGKKAQKQLQASQTQINYRIAAWVNDKNSQGFSPLHYAAFKGYIEILDYLAEIGANQEIRTKSGLNVLHLSAQGDQIKSFVFYQNKIAIDCLDERKSTPLHWAAFSGSQKVAEYLLSQRAENLLVNKKQEQNNKKQEQNNKKRQKKNKKRNPLLQQNIDWINAEDVEGQTALHLATTNGNTKIVRRLLLAGANRHIKNKEGKEPIDIARQNEFYNIEQFLDDNYNWLDYVKFLMNVKIKYEPRHKSFVMPIVFMCLALILIGIVTYSLEYQPEYAAIQWMQNGLFALLILLYLSLIFHSPQRQRGSYQKLLKIWLSKQEKPTSHTDHTFINSSTSRSTSSHKQTQSICFHCVQYKPRRSYHCDICKTCVAQYDHHCPWINNCVGKHNFGRFIFFIILLFLAINWLFIVSIHFTLYLVDDKYDKIEIFLIRAFITDNPAIMYLYVILSMLIFAIFSVPLILLIGVHLRNLYDGKTTHERFTKANQSLLKKSVQQSIEGRSSGLSSQPRKKCGCLEMCMSRLDDQKYLLS